MTLPFTQSHYREILRVGIRSGYCFAGFNDLPALRAGSQKTCLMRHDCDNDLLAAARIAEIEAEEGVKTTFFLMLRSAMYNVLAPTNGACVRQIIACGHWIGLHFDASVHRTEAEEQIA